MFFRLLLTLLIASLTACSAIRLPVTQYYQLTQFTKHRYQSPHGEASLFVSPPEALRGYDSIKMNYSTQA